MVPVPDLVWEKAVDAIDAAKKQFTVVGFEIGAGVELVVLQAQCGGKRGDGEFERLVFPNRYPCQSTVRAAPKFATPIAGEDAVNHIIEQAIGGGYVLNHSRSNVHAVDATAFCAEPKRFTGVHGVGQDAGNAVVVQSITLVLLGFN